MQWALATTWAELPHFAFNAVHLTCTKARYNYPNVFSPVFDFNPTCPFMYNAWEKSGIIRALLQLYFHVKQGRLPASRTRGYVQEETSVFVHINYHYDDCSVTNQPTTTVGWLKQTAPLSAAEKAQFFSLSPPVSLLWEKKRLINEF